MDFYIGDKRIPLAYTIWAKRELTKEFNDATGLQMAFNATDEVELAENMARIGSILSKAYAMRVRSMQKLVGGEDDSFPIEKDDLFGLLDRELALKLVEAIAKTVADSNKTSVEVSLEKKEEATE